MTKLSIGRDNDNDIVFSDNSVSRMHGFIFFEEDGSVFFEDLGSSNGSFVHGNRIYGKIQLKSTDILKVGKVLVPWHNYRGFVSINESSHQAKGGFDHGIPVGRTVDSIPPTNIPPRNNQSFLKYWPVLIGLAIIGIVAIVIISESGSGNKVEEPVKVNKTTTEPSDTNTVKAPEPLPASIDSDDDGVADENDDCPNKKGPAENKGCPFEDSDNDGTPDKDDECDDDYGPRRNDGCPEDIEYDYSESYRTECPYCNSVSYQETTDQYWKCGSCSSRFYNCFKTDDYGGVKIEWFNDGDCDCKISCYDED
jgi:ribosomal protein L37AE/L43A